MKHIDLKSAAKEFTLEEKIFFSVQRKEEKSKFFCII